MSAGIAVRDLRVRRAGRPVLNDVTFDAARGRVLALTGASGSGKSTLLRRRVALVAQAPVMLPGTVADNLAYGLTDLHEDARDAALVAAGLDPSFLPRTARALSGGERARVALARALTRDPDAILLDEPTAALDPDTARHIAETITALARRDLIVIVATHDLALAEAVADATLILTK
jgi:ABC-type multidrug transport system fused ATPase/permease subunit